MSLLVNLNENYMEELKSKLRVAEGFKPNVYIDSAGIPTIGIGYALLIKNSDGKYVVRSIDSINENFVGIYKFSNNDLSALKNLAAGLNKGASVSKQKETLLFEQDSGHLSVIVTEAQAEIVLERIVDDYEQKVKDQIKKVFSGQEGEDLFDSLNNSNEKIALVDLAYNNPTLVGKNLVTAIKNGDRAAAWFEIRYQSNKKDGNGVRSFGLDNRRIETADLFASYGDSALNSPSYEVTVTVHLTLKLR